jgi:hypothetical protein
MDFRQSSAAPANRAETATPVAPAPHPTVGSHPTSGKKETFIDNSLPGWLKLLNVAILFGIAILLTLIALSFSRSGNNFNETKYVDTERYQAVFLNNGQVYFGKITTLNARSLKLNGIYYLTQQNASATANAQAQTSGDYTLVKLGCQQIHYPTDQMIVNRDQVTFWENLSKDGKVAKSIEEFKKQNPNGPKCDNVSPQTQSSNQTNTQGGTAPSGTNGTTPQNASSPSTNR